jgi:hypothetical protein
VQFSYTNLIGLVNIKHLLLGPIKNYESPNDILSDSRYFKDVPLNEQVLLEMDNPGSNYFIASVQFANGSQGVYSNIMDRLSSCQLEIIYLMLVRGSTVCFYHIEYCIQCYSGSRCCCCCIIYISHFKDS